jgi:hypothetical protein
MSFPVRAQPLITQMRRGWLPACSRRHHLVDGPERPSGRTASPSGITPSNIMSPARSQPGSRTEVRLGARAHTTRTTNRAHAPPATAVQHRQPGPRRLTRGPAQSKEQRCRSERTRRWQERRVGCASPAGRAFSTAWSRSRRRRPSALRSARAVHCRGHHPAWFRGPGDRLDSRGGPLCAGGSSRTTPRKRISFCASGLTASSGVLSGLHGYSLGSGMTFVTR